MSREWNLVKVGDGKVPEMLHFFFLDASPLPCNSLVPPILNLDRDNRIGEVAVW